MRKIWLLLIILWGGKGFAQVSLQTGSATFNLPVFNWQDDKSRLNLNISLNYNSGNGLKVSDVASNVGQGWNLVAGGVITRLQAGEPDDQKAYGTEADGDLTRYPPGYLYDTSSANNDGCPKALTTYPVYKDKNHLYKQHNNTTADKELDHFAFQFNGRSGVFVLGKNSYGSLGPVFLGDTKMKIWFEKDEGMVSQGIRTTITAFYIQDENGLVYKFTEHNLTKILKTSFCDKNLNKQAQPKFKNNGVYHQATYDDNDPSIVNPYVIDGWYLTEIKDTLTNRKINFTYNLRNINANAGALISNYTSNNTGLFTPEKNYSIIAYSKTVTKTPAIASISYEDGHKVVFKYGNNRIDLNGDSVLSSIDISYEGRSLSRYELTTSYFVLNRCSSTPNDNEKKYARLCLRSVKKLGVDLKAADRPYVFDYWLGSGNPDDFVPPPFFHLKDIWGFYNGSNSSVSTTKSLSNLSNSELKGLCFHNGVLYNAKNNYAKNGLLKQIIYPTGGALNFEYAQDTALLSGQTVMANGVRVSKTSLTDGGYSSDCNNPQTTSYRYNMEGSNQPSLWGVEPPVNSLTTYNHYQPVDKQWFRFKLFPPSVGCDYHYKYPGILSRDQAMTTPFGTQALQFGLNALSTASTVKTIVSAISSGDPVTLIIQVVVDIAISCIGDHHMDNTTSVYYNSDLNGANPLPAQHKRVEVSQNSGSSGKTVYEFTSDSDYPIWSPSNPAFSMRQRYAYWAYGLPRKTTVYDTDGYPVTQTENSYDNQFANESFFCHSCPAAYTSYKPLVKRNVSQKSDNWNSQGVYDNQNQAVYITDLYSNSDMMVDKYDPITGRTLLSKTVEKVFKPHSSSQYLQTVTDYTYNEGDYLTGWNYEVNKIKTTHSNGDTTIKYIKYSGNYSGIYSGLTNSNISTLPVSVSTSFKKKGTTAEYYTGESVTEYTNLANGSVVPSKTLIQRFAEPQPSASMQFYGSSPIYKEPQTLIYDTHNNLSGIKDEGKRIVTNIYDYNDKYVVATVINADPGVDKPAYTSFEANDFTRSGWTMTGTPSYNTVSSVTGTRSLTLSSGKSLSATLNTTKPYKLSFWASSSGIVVSGSATLVKSAPTLNGFTYYEYNIAQGASSVTVSGSSNIDELRLYPKNARMSTVTYDPLIGKTSECDENNRITYYEYDELGRMRYIKDESKNIVKMYEYNVKSKATGCPTTYHNLPVSEVFTKNNCSAGYTGGDVTYTIPDSKYTSTVSQDEVDQKVQAELDANGQAYANANGACIKLYYNTAKSQVFTKGGCDIGYKGTTITYTVPANKYTSTISQADADEQAQDDIDANGDAFVNLSGNGSCIVDTDPYWQGEENSPADCRLVNGVAHKFVEVTDINPNSATHNQTQWVDAGEDASCPVSSVMYGRIEKDNVLGVNPEYSDFVIRFYADPYYTIPLSVSNYTVSYTISETETDISGPHSVGYTQHNVTCDGFETLIASSVITYWDYGNGTIYTADYFFNQATFPIP